MALALDPVLEQELRDLAKAKGFDSPEALLRDWVHERDRRYQDALVRIDEVAGSSDTGLTTEQIMATTRGED